MPSISSIEDKYLFDILDYLGPSFISQDELKIIASKCQKHTPKECAEGIKALRRRRAKEEQKNNT